MKARRYAPIGQRGAALLISLIMLLAMTILGVTAARQVTLQERMAGNLREGSIAFQAAESTLRQGEQWLRNNLTGNQSPPTPVSPTACNPPPPCILATAPDPMAPPTWSSNNRSDGPNIHRLNPMPKYYITERRRVSTSLNWTNDDLRVFYALTARAQTDGGAESILRSTYVVRY